MCCNFFSFFSKKSKVERWAQKHLHNILMWYSHFQLMPHQNYILLYYLKRSKWFYVRCAFGMKRAQDHRKHHENQPSCQWPCCCSSTNSKSSFTFTIINPYKHTHTLSNMNVKYMSVYKKSNEKKEKKMRMYKLVYVKRSAYVLYLYTYIRHK